MKDWGAKGDGTTNDRPAIQACINAGNGTVYMPAGTYALDATLAARAVAIERFERQLEAARRANLRWFESHRTKIVVA